MIRMTKVIRTFTCDRCGIRQTKVTLSGPEAEFTNLPMECYEENEVVEENDYDACNDEILPNGWEHVIMINHAVKDVCPECFAHLNVVMDKFISNEI